jgi:hypothetical protein
LTIDLTREKWVKLIVKVNSIYNPTNYSTNKSLTVKAYRLNVRYSAGIESKVFDVLERGEKVYLLGNSEIVGDSKWIEVCHNDYKVWLNSKHVN